MVSQEFQQSPEVKPRFFYGYTVVGAMTFIMIVAFGVYSAFGVFFKPVLTEFGWTRGLTAGAFSLSWVLQGLLGVFMGRLNDRLGPRTVIIICCFLLGLGYVLMSQVSAVWHIYLFYGLIIGAGMGGIWVPTNSTVVRWFTRRRSMMTGILNAGVGLGILVTPPIANWLISNHDWRISYVILGGVVFAFILVAARFLKRDPTKVGQRPYGENQADESELKVMIGGFSLEEAVSTRQFWMFLVLNFSWGFTAYVVTVHIVPHATDLGFSTATAANILATIGGLTVIGRVFMGTTADRIGNKQVIIIGHSLMALLSLCLIPAKEVWMLYLIATIFGFAWGSGTATSALVAELFGLKSHGLILGVLVCGYSAGGAIGPFMAGHIFDVTGSYQLAFLVCTALSITSVILGWRLRPTNRGSIDFKVAK